MLSDNDCCWTQIYTDELEKHKCFDYFTDFCERFELIRGKTTSEEENITVGEFKVVTYKIQAMNLEFI